MAKRSAVALNGGSPLAIDLLTTTVLPTPDHRQRAKQVSDVP